MGRLFRHCSRFLDWELKFPEIVNDSSDLIRRLHLVGIS